MIELYDHSADVAIDSFVSHDLASVARTAEEFIACARNLHQQGGNATNT